MQCPWPFPSLDARDAQSYHGRGQKHAGAGRRAARALALSLTIAAIAGPAITGLARADGFLDGTYGSPDGCTYDRTGESSGADDFLLLTNEGVTTSVSACTFEGSPTATASGFTIKAQCESEDGDGPQEIATLQKSDNAYTVRFPDGTKLGPMPKCP